MAATWEYLATRSGESHTSHTVEGSHTKAMKRKTKPEMRHHRRISFHRGGCQVSGAKTEQRRGTWMDWKGPGGLGGTDGVSLLDITTGTRFSFLFLTRGLGLESRASSRPAKNKSWARVRSRGLDQQYPYRIIRPCITKRCNRG